MQTLSTNEAPAAPETCDTRSVRGERPTSWGACSDRSRGARQGLAAEEESGGGISDKALGNTGSLRRPEVAPSGSWTSLQPRPLAHMRSAPSSLMSRTDAPSAPSRVT